MGRVQKWDSSYSNGMVIKSYQNHLSLRLKLFSLWFLKSHLVSLACYLPSWMASPTQWTWVWVSSGSWWRTGKLGVLQAMGSQRVDTMSDWPELNSSLCSCLHWLLLPVSCVFIANELLPNFLPLGIYFLLTVEPVFPSSILSVHLPISLTLREWVTRFRIYLDHCPLPSTMCCSSWFLVEKEGLGVPSVPRLLTW